ncbi:SDR family NAD(P)-dependent oxidoreductase [Polymorphobacter fuscus]|uniref:SDR family NAD(P)-dependent oxidoreductase n=1 Tax=Sandarakinorhabdus fusca TaxID=1439888 RepID=A0A7C9KVF7_9SPHN|nr:SDR family NAD(P)-dependent oxidoreductase [Polymorphobacter fuscus]KAB7648649.1 SDR family NAD(P)-dependent oxidoreductase [Polymorphobacter fuscus]MQT16205.1 SDR family NAD(P)-dependent oxidoreductase [Polymorphobacter fuscus]NJC07510.1 NAD(P)-dependent dehydrogenase (short-subunit alcohol dehydrogenase family) [Polymorphobacter fuscus]
MTVSRNQTAIVTGGARRIGAAFVRALAADGWHVLIHCNTSRADADALAAEVGNAAVVAADLADSMAAAAIIAAAATLPPLGLLVNSASRFVLDDIDDFSVAAFDTHMAINLRAPALLTRAFAAAVPTDDAPALVVNMLDAKLEALNPDYFTYTLSKIGLDGLTELTARAYAPRLRCAAIAPAVTLVSGPQSRDNFDAVHGMNPLRRGVAVEEIVAALRFIIATPTFNAQTITLDGGQRLLGLPRDVAFMVDK